MSVQQLTTERLAGASLSKTVPVNLRINGQKYTLDIEPRVSLLDALREYLHLTGSKKGCNQGACGACTILCEGERILSCLSLAVQYEDREITTIERLANEGKMHPLQAAFIEHDGLQCGYCTPGQICSAVGMMHEIENHLPIAVTSQMASDDFELTDEELRERMSGNPNAKFLGGGTNLADLMRENIEQPEALVDATRLSPSGIADTEGGGIFIGAEVKNSAVANYGGIRPAPVSCVA